MGPPALLTTATQLVLRFKIAVLLVVLLATAGAIWTSRTVTFDGEVDIWFLEDDPELRTYRTFLETFDTDEMVVVGLFADNVFAPEVLQGMHELTQALATVPQVHRVRALTNASRFESRGRAFAVVPVVPRLPVTATQAISLRQRALDDPLIVGTLASPDGHAAAIVIELSSEARSFESKVALVRGLQSAVFSHPVPGAELRMAGTPVINEAVLRYSQRDFQVLGSISVGLMLLITFLMFRHVWAALLPLLVVVIAVLWLFGLMGLLGLNLNLVSQSLTVVVFAVGIADAIHVITEYQHQLLNHSAPKVALQQALEQVLRPCLFTTLTTAAGMLSLTTSQLAPVREFGVLAAVGVVLALILSFTFLPAALSLTKPPAHARLARQDGGPLNRLLSRTALLSRTRRRPILLAFGATVALSAFLVPQLKVGANPAAYFKTDDPVRRDMRRIDLALGGSTSIELLVTAKDQGLQDPENIARLDGLQSWLQELPSIARVVSVSDGLRAVHRVMLDEDRLPRTRAELGQAYLLLEDEPDFAALMTADYETARISARVRMSEAAALVSRIPEIEAKLETEFADDALRVQPTGFVKLISEMEMYIVDAQIDSFGLAFGIISCLMIILLRSFKLGLLSMIPNLGPVIVGLAIMFVLKIQLDPGTAMLGSLTLGLVVDDTVHMTSRIRHNLAAGLAIRAAVSAAVVEVGRALTITSVILASGFAVLALGSFTPNIYLGIMAAVIIVLALVADLLVLPAALMPAPERATKPS